MNGHDFHKSMKILARLKYFYIKTDGKKQWKLTPDGNDIATHFKYRHDHAK